MKSLNKELIKLSEVEKRGGEVKEEGQNPSIYLP